MGRLLLAPVLLAGLLAAPPIALSAHDRDSDRAPGAPFRRSGPPPRRAFPQVGSITGTVTATTTNEPLDGVTVQIEGTRLGATTNEAGQCRITNVPAGTHTLTARRLGYARATKQVTVSDDAVATVSFSLDKTATTLDQIVVTGTPQAQTKRELGNAIGIVSAAEVTKVATHA